MGLTDQQRKAAQAPGSVAVVAGAGTGKTHMLSERYLYHLQQGCSPLQMVAVTFTEKAATELRSRIRQTIAQQMSDRPDLLAELEAAQISTFHALATRICREHPAIAQVPPDFAIQDAVDAPIWQAEMLADILPRLPQRLFDQISFSRMREILNVLLTDPMTANQSLQRDRSHWLPVLEAMRHNALKELCSHDDWQSSKVILENHAAPGDKLETHRSAALEAIADLEQGENLAIALGNLDDLKVNVGSQKNWGGKENMTAVKDAIRAIRDLARDALKKNIILLVPNEYDDQTEALLPDLREAFDWIQTQLNSAKEQQRILNFNDLEIRALQALQDISVQHYYAQRWQVFLIDEFQDTNATQGKLLELLTAQAKITIVGDAKQSIYGFRRADVSVFQSWQQRIHSSDPPVELSLSFRTHRILMERINQVFEPILLDLHQPLDAQRCDSLDPPPDLHLYAVTVDQNSAQSQKWDKLQDNYWEQDGDLGGKSDGKPDEDQTSGSDTSISARRRVEAQHIASLVQDLLTLETSVHDKATNTIRPIRPEDIAILSQTWNALEFYGEAIASRGIPILQGGGGNLLETREAKDGWALLQWIADPTDNLSLATLLRSPFFALSDRLLYALAQTLPDRTSWWKALGTWEDPEMTTAHDTLRTILAAGRTEAPSRLLQISDRLTGYTAVVANLPGADRRMADWAGFIDLVRSLEAGRFDIVTVIRRLKRIHQEGIAIARPHLAGSNAVNLMTIHAAKGLEWPVVIVADLARSPNQDTATVQMDPNLGVALKLEDREGQPQRSALYTLLQQRQAATTQAEAKRLLYVAMTRARDRLILTSPSPKGGHLDLLQPSLIAGHLTLTPIPFAPHPTQAIAPPQSTPVVPVPPLHQPLGAGLSELPVTALSDYALCPLRFRLRYVDGHPGYREGDGHGAMSIGRLAHKALELGIRDASALRRYAPNLSMAQVQDALDCAEKFDQADIFAPYRQGALQWEVPVDLTINGLTLHGVVDLVGADFVLDFKTDRYIQPTHHQFQLWAYSRATSSAYAHLAYLRHDHIHTFDSAALNKLNELGYSLVKHLEQGKFSPTPEHDRCGICPYAEICESRWDNPG